MSPSAARVVLRLDAVISVAAGILLLAGTWDGLYDALDLPQQKPATFVQVGGAVLVGTAYVLWAAPRSPVMTRIVALGAAVAAALAAAVLLVWLIFEDPGTGTQGDVELWIVAVVLAGMALAEAAIWRSSPPE